MPRERIQHSQIVRREQGNTGWVEATPALDVDWRREGESVQLSIEFNRETWLGQAKDLETQPNAYERAIYTENLDRKTINHLIRTLKRARDAAYGADE